MGRYRVHIPEIMQHLPEEKGIWCKNQVHAWRITPSENGEYGSYFPLHPQTKVIVQFYENDYNTGYIERIISDADDSTDLEAQDATKENVKPSLTDRDEQYIIFKTPKKFNIFYINEETEKEPNTIYLVYNRDESPERRTVLRIDESGVHVWTRDNNRVRIIKDDNKQIDGNKSLYVKLDRKANIAQNEDLAVGQHRTVNVHQDEDKAVLKDRRENIHGQHDLLTKKDKIENVYGSSDVLVKGNMTIEVNGNCNISVGGTCNVYSETAINADAPTINLNSGIASKSPSKIAGEAHTAQPRTEVIDLGPKETDEYDSDKAVGQKCDDVTKPDGGYGPING
jgi:hypothetical protein